MTTRNLTPSTLQRLTRDSRFARPTTGRRDYTSLYNLMLSRRRIEVPEVEPIEEVEDRRFLGPTPMEVPLRQFIPPGFELTNEQLFDIRQRLHTEEGLPAQEWEALSPPIQQNILQGREQVRPAAEFVGGRRIEGERVKAYEPFQPEPRIPEALRPIQEVGRGLTELASYPLFEVAGVGVSAADIVGIGLLGYTAFRGIRTLTPKVKTAARTAGGAIYEKTLAREMDAMIARRARGVPKEQFTRFQNFVFERVAADKAGIQQRATERMLSRMGRSPTPATARQAAKAAAEETVRDIERSLVPRATQTGAMAMGGLPAERPVPGVALPPGLKKPIESLSTAELQKRVKTASPHIELYQAELDRRAVPEEAVPVIPEVLAPEVSPEAVTAPPAAPPTEIEPEIPTPPVEPPAAPPVAPTALVPAEPPVPPEVPPVEIVGTPEPAKWAGLIHPLQDVNALVEKMTRPDFARTVANLPIMKQIMSEVNPSAVADTLAKKAAMAQAALFAEIENKTTSIMAHVFRKGDMNRILGSTNSQGIITKGSLKGENAYDVIEFPSKYTLTKQQKEWLDLAQDIEKAAYNYLVENGIEMHEAKLLADQVYASRNVVGRTSPTGEIIEIGHVGVGRRLGAKIGSEKARVFPTVKEAQEAGFRYLPYDAALNAKVEGVLRRVANKKVADWVLSQREWRSTAADPETVLASEQAKDRSHKSQRLKQALNRAVRGERVPDVTIRSIATQYPEQAQELKELIPLLQKGKPTARRVKALTQTTEGLVQTDKMNALRAVNARARSREHNLKATSFEGQVSQAVPAFAGKIFTGPEAKELASQLSELLAPKNPQLLQKILAELAKPGMVSRFMVLAGDFSPLMIQLIVDMSAHPLKYAKSGPAVVQGLADPRFVQNYMTSEKAQRVFARLPELITPAGNATEFTEAMGAGGPLAAGPVVRPAAEETITAALIKTPFRGGRKIARAALVPFQNAYEAIMTVAQVEIADSLLHLAVDQESASDVAQYVNTLNGMTSSARLGVSQEMRLIETSGALAPRYTRGVASFIFEAGKGAIGAGGLRGRLSVIAMTKFLVGISALAIGITLAKREPPDNILKHLNPTDKDFMTWTFGDTRLGIGSKYRSIFRTIGQAASDPESVLQLGMENPWLRFIRGQLAPVPGTAIDILTGRNFIGDPSRDNLWSFTENVVLENLLPVWMQSTLLEGGDVKNRVVRGAAEFVGARAYPDTVWSEVRNLREVYAKQQFGERYENLRSAERKDLLREHPDLADLEKQGDMEMAERGSEFTQWRLVATETSKKDMHDSLEQYAIALEAGAITRYEYDKNRARIRAYYSGEQSVIWAAGEILDPSGEKEYRKWVGDNQHHDDKAKDDYYTRYSELIETADLPVDWDSINVAMGVFLRRYSKSTQQYINEHLNDWIKDLPPAARRIEEMRLAGIETGTWWDNYRGGTQRAAPVSGRDYSALKELMEARR